MYLWTWQGLDRLLVLPEPRRHQFLWCYTTDCWCLHPDPGRALWTLELPQDEVLAFVYCEHWEFLIGSGTIPAHLHREWRRDPILRGLTPSRQDCELQRRKHEYLDSKPPRSVSLDRLLVPARSDETVCALVPLPLLGDWIGPYDLRRRYAKLRYPNRRIVDEYWSA